MKIWLKYLIAIALGLISTFVIPMGSAQAEVVLNFLVELVIRFGRYIIIPLIFFSISTACFKLRDEKQMLKTAAWTFGTIIVSSLALTVFGLIISLIVHLPPIPITLEKTTEIPEFTWQTLLTKLFPYSAFQSILDGSYLLPCFIFAGLIGSAAVSDKNSSKPAITLFESISKICYTILSLFTEVLTVGLVAVMTRWTLNFKTAIQSGNYTWLIIMLFIELIFIAMVIYPLVLRFVCHEHHPYKVLYASVSSFLVAFFSGDTNLTLGLNLRNGKENLGIKDRTSYITYPLFSIFGRGGASLVISTCFVLILRSYSTLGISASDALWIGLVSFGLSFALGEIPIGGPFFAIIIMCTMYGRGNSTGYLLLKEVAPIICAFAAGIDALTASVGSYITAVKTKNIMHQDVKKYI